MLRQGERGGGRCNPASTVSVSLGETQHTLMPYTGMVLTILAVVFGFFLVLLAHWIAAAGIFVETTDACRRKFAERPVRCALTGILTFGVMLVSVLAAATGPGAGFVLLLAAFPLLVSFVGTAGIALHLGSRLCGDGNERWRMATRGGVILGLCFITPALGWFIVAPVGLASGFGAFLLAKPWKSRAAAAPALP